MQLALGDLYRAKWTERIHNEWMRNVMANRPDLSRQKIERTRTLMDLHTRMAFPQSSSLKSRTHKRQHSATFNNDNL